MSAENVELVREMHEQMQGLNLAAEPEDPEAQRAQIRQVYAPDVKLAWGATNPEARTYEGYDGLEEAFSEWTSAFDEYYLDALEFTDAGEHVIVRTHQRGKGKTSGVPIDLDCWIVYTFRDGKIVALREYDDATQALEAAGLGT